MGIDGFVEVQHEYDEYSSTVFAGLLYKYHNLTSGIAYIMQVLMMVLSTAVLMYAY